MKNMKIFKLFFSIAIPILIGAVTFCVIESFLENKIQVMLETKDLTSISKEYGSIYKDKGIILNEYFSKKDTITIQGSSELGADVPQVPTVFFPVKGLSSEVVTNGRAYVQSLQQVSILGSQDIDLSNNKIAIVVSLQWFENQKGIDGNSFSSTFSPVQFYGYLNNEKISNELKIKYATRVNELLSNSSQFAAEKLYSYMYIKDNFISSIGKVFLKPYYFIRERVIIAKDKGLLYRKLRELPEKGGKAEGKDINWEEERIKAEEQGKAAVTNNDFYVNDTYFDAYLRGNVNSQKDSSKNIDLMISREFDDYKLYLDTCKELGISPYIIIMPTNGLWYDHKGMKKEKRDEFYDEIEKLAREKNFDALNLKDEEYNSYFMVDVMHLGWKGWLRIDEEIYNKFK